MSSKHNTKFKGMKVILGAFLLCMAFLTLSNTASAASKKTGWVKSKSNYCYYDRTTGKQKKNCKVDGIKLDKNGYAKKTDANVKRIKTMIKARKVMLKITKTSDSKKVKLEKCFKWVMNKPYIETSKRLILKYTRKKKAWETLYANQEFKLGRGCCVSEACAFAYLAYECGYKNVYICDDTEHAWVQIDGKVYDTLFAVSKSYSRYYGSTYKQAGLWRHNRLKMGTWKAKKG